MQSVLTRETFSLPERGSATDFGRLAERVATDIPEVLAESLLRILTDHYSPADVQPAVARYIDHLSTLREVAV